MLEPPIVRGRVPFLGAALDYGRDARAFLSACRARHGDVFTVVLMGQRMTFVCDPRCYPDVLRRPELRFEPIADRVLDRAFGCPDLDAHIDRDHVDELARTLLKGEQLEALSAEMCRGLAADFETCAELQGDEGVIELHAFVRRSVLEVATGVLFGADHPCAGLSDAFERFDRAFPLLVAGAPRLFVRGGLDGREAMAVRTSSHGASACAWIRARHEACAALDPHLRGRIQTVALWAANANTIPTVFWALAHSLGHPQAWAAIQAEVDAQLGARDTGDTGDDIPTAAQLAELPIVDSVTRETLRLCSGSLTVRQASCDFALELRSGSWAIREGDQLCLAPLLVQVDPRVYEDPLRFRHDRFVGSPRLELDGEHAGLAYMPFGAGRNTCPGRFFAMNQVRAFVAMFCHRFELGPALDPLPELDPRRAGIGIYLPKGELRVRWRRRARQRA